jgi:hypothetical protein
MGGMCSKDGSLAKKACASYSVEKVEVTYIDPDTFQIVEGSTIDECTTCADAYYDANGIAMCRRYNAQLDMSDLTACPEYTEDSDESKTVN